MIQLPRGFKLRAGAELHGPLPRMVERISRYLDRLKFQEVLNTFQLSQSIGASTQAIQGHCAHPYLAGYRFNIQTKSLLWGSKKTIAELKKQLEKA